MLNNLKLNCAFLSQLGMKYSFNAFMQFVG